jgi:hypothetical protein
VSSTLENEIIKAIINAIIIGLAGGILALFFHITRREIERFFPREEHEKEDHRSQNYTKD